MKRMISFFAVFLTASILASVFGADVRKARASQEVAKVEAAAIDSTLMAVTTLATGDKLKVAPKGATRDELRQVRKYNEQVNKAKETNKGKMQTIQITPKSRSLLFPRGLSPQPRDFGIRKDCMGFCISYSYPLVHIASQGGIP